MVSKENLYDISKNAGKLVLAGAALYAAAQQVDQTSHNPEINQTVVRGQVLTESEITQIRNYDNLVAVSARIESTATAVSSPVAEPEMQKVEKLEVAQMTTESAQLIDKYKAELPNILTKIGADVQQVEDLTIYYPIYRAAQDRYGVPWELIWIIHQAESTVSRNEAAFENNIHFGPMQRAVQFHPQEDVDRANVGMEYLQALPVRHFNDAAEIVWGSAAIAEWAGIDQDYQRALFRYSAPGPATERFQRFLELEVLLKN